MSSNSIYDTSRAEFWSRAYREDLARWDLGSPTPVFVDILENPQQLPAGARTLQPGSILVPGCGYGHDAVLFAGRGFDVTAVDFAPEPLRVLEEAASKLGQDVSILERDVFTLAQEYDGVFDYILEYVTICAIEPTRLLEYVDLLHRFLKPYGWVIGLIFPTDGRPGGPPYSIDMAELNGMLKGKFRVLDERVHPASIKPRYGKEVFVVWEKIP